MSVGLPPSPPGSAADGPLPLVRPELPAATHSFAPEIFAAAQGLTFWFQSTGPNYFASHRHPQSQVAVGYGVHEGCLGWQEAGQPAQNHTVGGDLIWFLPRNADHTVRLRHPGFWIVFFFDSLLDPAWDVAIKASIIPLQDYVRHDVLIGELGTALRRERRRPAIEDPTHAEKLGALLGSCLLRTHTRELVRASPVQALSAEVMDRIRRYILDHLGEPLSVATLARVAGMAPDHFTRRLRFSTGLTAEQFVRHEKLNHAKVLLASGGHSVEEVATLCGFSSHAAMTRQFALRFGRPPRTFVHQDPQF